MESITKILQIQHVVKHHSVGKTVFLFFCFCLKRGYLYQQYFGIHQIYYLCKSCIVHYMNGPKAHFKPTSHIKIHYIQRSQL